MIYFFFLIFMMTSCLNGMEGQQEELPKVAVQNYETELFRLPEMEFKKFDYKACTEYIKELEASDKDSIKVKIGTLHTLINLLISTNIAFEELQNNINRFDSEALKSSNGADIQGFYFPDEDNVYHEMKQKGLNVTEDDEHRVMVNKSNIAIDTTEGKAALLRFVPLHQKYHCITKVPLANRELLENCLSDINTEVALIATHVKNLLFQKERTVRIIGIAKLLFYPLQCLEKYPDCSRWESFGRNYLTQTVVQDISTFATENYYAVLIKWLESKKELQHVSIIAPQALWVYEFINSLTHYMRCFQSSGIRKETLNKIEQESFSSSLAYVLDQIRFFCQSAPDLYLKLMQSRYRLLSQEKKEKKMLIALNRIVFLNLARKDTFCYAPTHLTVRSYHSEDKEVPKKNLKKIVPKKRKPHKRYNKRKEPSTEENDLFLVQEKAVDVSQVAQKSTFYPTQKKSMNIPNEKMFSYDDRVLRWLNPEFTENMQLKESSQLYHTFHFFSDVLMKRHGNFRLIPNNKNPNLNNTYYYMNGEIHYADGKKLAVIFHCIVGPDGVCFHRGYDKDVNLLSTMQSAYQWNYPPLYDDSSYEFEIKRCDIKNKDLYATSEYHVNDFCFYLHDTFNDVDIVLFKPT